MRFPDELLEREGGPAGQHHAADVEQQLDGPSTMAPMTRIWESTTIAMLASSVASVRNAR